MFLLIYVNFYQKLFETLTFIFKLVSKVLAKIVQKKRNKKYFKRVTIHNPTKICFLANEAQSLIKILSLEFIKKE